MHSNRDDLVGRFIGFQQTGSGFEGVWEAGLGDIVVEFSRRSLRRLGVRVSRDDTCVGDVTGMTVQRLMEMGNSASGRFDPEKASQPGLGGFRGWLWGVIANQAATWVRRERGNRKVRMIPESALGSSDWNGLPDADERPSIVKAQVAKIERPDLLPILEECINDLEDRELRELMRLTLHEGLSQARIAKRLGMSSATVCRRIQLARKLLKPLLEARGVDESWLAA